MARKPGQLLHRLMRRAVFAHADAVMREDIERLQLAERAQAHRRLHVIGEHKNVALKGSTPPCAAMPFTAAPMACSRTPKATLRPA